MRYPRVLGLLLFLGSSGLAVAQSADKSFEVSPFVGYLFGGDVWERAPDLPSLSVDDHVDYGIRVGFRATSHWVLEMQWTRVPTELSLGFSLPQTHPVNMDYLIAGVAYELTGGSLRPYVLLGVGAAFFDPKEVPSETRFTGSLALGLKAFFTPALGLRVEARGYASSLDDTPLGFPCTTFDGSGGPVVPRSCAKSWLFNGDLTGGLIVAF